MSAPLSLASALRNEARHSNPSEARALVQHARQLERKFKYPQAHPQKDFSI